MNDRDWAVNYLRFWWNATPMASLGLTTYQDALAYYDGKSSTFLSQLGRTVKAIRQDKIRTAFEKLAAQYGDKYPPPAEFYAAIADQQQTFDLGDAKEVAAKTVTDVGTAVKFGASAYLLIVLVGLAVVVLPMLKETHA